MSPEPYPAIENAIEHYRIDDILISTLKGEQSKWLEEGLIEKVEAPHRQAGRAHRVRAPSRPPRSRRPLDAAEPAVGAGEAS